jgi:hypothetical protein
VKGWSETHPHILSDRAQGSLFAQHGLEKAPVAGISLLPQAFPAPLGSVGR